MIFIRKPVSTFRDHALASPAQCFWFERIDEGAAFGLCRDPFVLDAHPPARLRVRVVDQHQARIMHEAFALAHHDLPVLVEEDAHENLEDRRERRHPARRGPEDLVHLGALVGDRGDRGQANHRMAVAVHFFDPQAGQPIGDFSLDLLPERLVDEVLRRQWMAHHPPAQLDRLELLFLRPQLGGLVLEPPRRMHERGMGRIHETEGGVVGRAGERQHDGRRRHLCIGEHRHARRLRRLGDRLAGPREVDPDEALALDARIGAAADLGEIDDLALAQRWDLHAGAALIETPAVIAAGDGLAVEAAVVQRDAPVRADIAQREHLAVAAAADQHGLAEQRLVHGPTRFEVGADERDVPQSAHQFGFEILHRPVPGPPQPPGFTSANRRRRLCRHQHQIGIVRFGSRLRQHAMHLTTVMGLVIEHVRHQEPLRFAQLGFCRARIPGQLVGEPSRVEAIGPIDNHRIERLAFALERVPVGIERHRFRDAAWRAGDPGEAAHPGTVAPEQVAQRSLDRAEEGAARLPTLGVGQGVGCAVEAFVLPAIVARHALHVAEIDHGLVSRRTLHPSRSRGFGLLDDRLECGRLADRQIRQHLAVDLEPGFAEAVDEPAIGETEGAHRRVEALDPERTEGALAPLAVAEGVLVGLLHRLLGDADGILAPAVKALGGLEDLLVLGVAGDAAFDACHGWSP